MHLLYKLSLITMTLLLLVAIQACEKTSESKEALEQPQESRFQIAYINTPYSALVHPISARTISNGTKDTTDIHQDIEHQAFIEYEASVIETFRGQSTPTIRYRIQVNSNEKVIVSDVPIVVTLCESEGVYYLPNSQAIFTAKIELKNIVDTLQSSLPKDQSEFLNCTQQ